MRVAVAGKGGAGKTTIAATAARLMASGGRDVIAVDADSNPNLGVALGAVSRSDGVVASLPASLLSRRLDRTTLTDPIDAVLAEHAMVGPDEIRLVNMGAPGHADDGCLCSAHAVVSALLAELATRADTLTIVDFEASPEHLSRGTARHADVLLLVTEPYYRALEAVGRLAALAAELPIGRIAVVANKVRSPDDEAAIEAYCQRHDLELVASVPWSDELLDVDRCGGNLFDSAPGSAVVHSVRQILAAVGVT